MAVQFSQFTFNYSPLLYLFSSAGFSENSRRYVEMLRHARAHLDTQLGSQ